jgi:outer membrane lipoprotein
MARINNFFLLISYFFLLSGCAHVISPNLRDRVNPALTFREVLDNPDFFQGKSVIWGGEIIQTTNQRDGTTLIEVFQRPLGWRGEPKETIASEGRFLATFDKYLDSYVFRRGRKITVAGEILGEKVKPLGEMDYRYPLVAGREVYLWEEYYYHPYSHNYYYYPGWAYPYWWRFGIFYHRHR